MTDPNTAQAIVLIAALQEQLNEMAPRLDQFDREASIGPPRRTRVDRLHAARLLDEVNHAQFMIAQLRRRFPAADTDVPTRVSGVG